MAHDSLKFEQKFLEFLLREHIFAILLITHYRKADENILRNDLNLPFHLEGIEQLPEFTLLLLYNLPLHRLVRALRSNSQNEIRR